MGTLEADLGLSPMLSPHASLTRWQGGETDQREANRDGEEGISMERLGCSNSRIWSVDVN